MKLGGIQLKSVFYDDNYNDYDNANDKTFIHYIINIKLAMFKATKKNR